MRRLWSRWKWIRQVPAQDTFTVREYIPMKRKMQKKSVAFSDACEVKEVERVVYSSDEDTTFDDTQLFSLQDYLGGDLSEILSEASDVSDDTECKELIEAGLPLTFGAKTGKDVEVVEPLKKKQKRHRCTTYSELYDATDILTQPAPEYVASEVSSPPAWDHDQVLAKYWYQRFALWSKYDEGIWMDTVGWYSVTPEAIAAHIAKRCSKDGSTLLIWDPFGGLGGNAIQFALHGHHVICSDVSEERLRMAQHNAKVYGVEDYIDFVLGDFFKLVGGGMGARVKPDVVFLSPPWGGPSYLSAPAFNVETMMDINGRLIFDTALTVTDNIVYFIPKNSSLHSIASLLSGREEKSFEVEENYLDDRLKSLSMYYGPLFR